MKIQIAGDLHIEYIDFEDSNVSDLLQPGDTDLLILAGDIGSLYEPQKLRFFLEKRRLKLKLKHKKNLLKNIDNTKFLNHI